MPDDLYHRDIMAWSEQQSARLRRVAAGERVNDVDWENVIEEIESLGRSELNAVRSLLYQALLHGLKIAAWPGHSARNHWLHEMSGFLGQAKLNFEPGMAQKLAFDDLFRKARRDLAKLSMDGARPGPVSTSLVLNSEDLLNEHFGADDLLVRISPEAAAPAPD